MNIKRGPQPVRRGGLPQAQARVLEYLQSQTDPVRVEVVAAAFEQHPNTVREHLDALVGVGLVLRERVAAAGRGRPAWQYRANPERPEPDSRVREYGALAGALAAHIATSSGDPAASGRAAGRLWGQSLASVPTADARSHVVDLLQSLDFSPRVDPEGVVLTTCPLLDVAMQYPDVVCAVHEGMLDGVLDSLESNLHVRLLPFAEPDGCRVCLEVPS